MCVVIIFLNRDPRTPRGVEITERGASVTWHYGTRPRSHSFLSPCPALTLDKRASHFTSLSLSPHLGPPLRPCHLPGAVERLPELGLSSPCRWR